MWRTSAERRLILTADLWKWVPHEFQRSLFYASWHDLSGHGDEAAPFVEYVAQCRAGQPPLQFLLDRRQEDGLDPESLMQTQAQIRGQGDKPFRWPIYQTEATEVEAPEAGH